MDFIDRAELVLSYQEFLQLPSKVLPYLEGRCRALAAV